MKTELKVFYVTLDKALSAPWDEERRRSGVLRDIIRDIVLTSSEHRLNTMCYRLNMVLHCSDIPKHRCTHTTHDRHRKCLRVTCRASGMQARVWSC